MSLTLYFHPLASYCHKALIAFYENDVPFEPVIVDLLEPASRAAFEKVWPMARFPVIRDHARSVTVAESSVIVEYLDVHFAKKARLVPTDFELAWRARMLDRFFDGYVMDPMSKIVTDNLRPEGQHDPHGVAQARKTLQTAYAFLEQELAANIWAIGDAFTLADCAAAPALFYADKVAPFRAAHPNLAAYSARLEARPSFARVLDEAKPYLAMFPG